MCVCGDIENWATVARPRHIEHWKDMVSNVVVQIATMFCHGCFFSKSLPSACILVTKKVKSSWEVWGVRGSTDARLAYPGRNKPTSRGRLKWSVSLGGPPRIMGVWIYPRKYYHRGRKCYGRILRIHVWCLSVCDCMTHGKGTNSFGLRIPFADARGIRHKRDKFFFLIGGIYNCSTATYLVISVRIWKWGARLYWCPTCVSRTE